MRPRSAHRSTSTRHLALAGALAAASLFGDSARGDQGPSVADRRQHVLELARAVDLLEKRATLAAADTFYLVVDPAKSRLVLMLQNAVLRDYEIVGLEVGSPRVAFRRRRLAEDWQGRLWSQGTLVPPREQERIEIVPPDSTTAASDSTKPIVIPPTPEEKYPVPHRYHVRYAGGLSLEVRPRELDTSVKWTQRASNAFAVWYHDFRGAIADRPEDTVRLRLVLRPEDATSLYRALPPATRLLVLPASSS